MRILAVGDIVGENGVKKLKETLPKIRQEHAIDFCIINGENAAGGMGITTKIFRRYAFFKNRCYNNGKSYMG